MVNAYYILDDGEQQGPYTFDELIEMEIDIHTRVLSPLADTWQDACDLPEFYPYFLSQGVYFPTEDNLASFWWRLAAFIIDFFIIVVIMCLGNLILMMKGIVFDRTSPHQISLFEMVLYSVMILYFSIFEASGIKGSIGKKICGLVVVDCDGMGISFPVALLRNLVKPVSFLFFGAGFFIIFFTEHRQALHDFFARTYVVKPD
jgi:uncharacterized RDD family membrane protein YckC